jgi:hypothetical protein
MPVIYHVTTNFIRGSKIGFWNGEIKRLWSRYLTYYGPEITFSLFTCQSKTEEQEVHQILKSYRLQGSRELYQEGAFQECEDHLIFRFGLPQIYDSTGFEHLKNGSTVSALTPVIITEKIEQVLRLEHIEQGLTAMIEQVIPTLFRNENGKWTIRVANEERTKLIIRIDTGDFLDSGREIAGLLIAPFTIASINAIEETQHPAKVEKTIDEISDGTIWIKIIRALLRMAPLEFSENKIYWTDAHQHTHDEAMKLMRRYRRHQAQKEKIESMDVDLENFLDTIVGVDSGFHWHPKHHLIVRLTDDYLGFSIIGRRENRLDPTLSLTESDIAWIKQAGFEDRIESTSCQCLKTRVSP